jgi:tetratricopeptide (TPR) repeat protein
MILVALAAGVYFVVSFLPAIGERVGNFFFNPNEPIEKSPHADALAAVARGDYPKAIKAYEDVLDEDSEDSLALSELASLYCEKLHEPARAAIILREALAREWNPEAAAFLSSRLVDVYWKYLNDEQKARDLLLRIIETYAGTRHAANARHRLHGLR